MYASNRTGEYEIYVRTFPGPGREYRVSREPGSDPAWGKDDSEMIFLGLDGVIVATLRFEPQDVVVEGQGQPFLDTSYWNTPDRRHYDVHPDGTRLLMLEQGDAELTHSTIHVIENWFADLPVPKTR